MPNSYLVVFVDNFTYGISLQLQMARAAMGNTIGWATNAVKSAFSRSVGTDPVNEETCK